MKARMLLLGLLGFAALNVGFDMVYNLDHATRVLDLVLLLGTLMVFVRAPPWVMAPLGTADFAVGLYSLIHGQWSPMGLSLVCGFMLVTGAMYCHDQQIERRARALLAAIEDLPPLDRAHRFFIGWDAGGGMQRWLIEHGEDPELVTLASMLLVKELSEQEFVTLCAKAEHVDGTRIIWKMLHHIRGTKHGDVG